MEEMRITDAAAADYGAIADIYNGYIQAGNVTMDETVYDADKIAAWVAGFSGREKLLVLRKENDMVAGWGVIKKYSDRNGYRFTCETSVFLAPDELGKGYGTLLKKRMIDECRALGYHHIVARIVATNEASIAYNLKLGYTIVGIQKETGFKEGKWMDTCIMQYLIK